MNRRLSDNVKHSDHLDGAQDALNRMRRAADRGTGCHLTAAMIESLGLTSIGEMWEQADPRTEESDEPTSS